jgi:Zn-dependent M16 (insulinase) family peptidase
MRHSAWRGVPITHCLEQKRSCNCYNINLPIQFMIFVIFVGVFSFLSYRDPNLLKTLDVYDGTGAFLRQLQMDNDTLSKAIIGTIGDVDSYQLPDAKGYSRYVENMFQNLF